MNPESPINESERLKKTMELAREQNMLASERTFLSWIRTGIAIVGAGIVIIRFVGFHSASEQIFILIAGKTLIFWGIAIFLLSLFDFRRVHKDKNVSMPDLTNIFVHSLIASLIVISLFLLVAV